MHFKFVSKLLALFREFFSHDVGSIPKAPPLEQWQKTLIQNAFQDGLTGLSQANGKKKVDDLAKEAGISSGRVTVSTINAQPAGQFVLMQLLCGIKSNLIYA